MAKLRTDDLAEVDFTVKGKVGSCGNCKLTTFLFSVKGRTDHEQALLETHFVATDVLTLAYQHSSLVKRSDFSTMRFNYKVLRTDGRHA